MGLLDADPPSLVRRIVAQYSTAAPTYHALHLPFNVPFDSFVYNQVPNPPIPPSWLAGEHPTTLANSRLQRAPSYAHTRGFDDHQALAQSMPFVTPTVTGSAVDPTGPLYTAPGPRSALAPTAPMLPAPAFPAPNNNNESTMWSNQLSQIQMRGGHPAMPTPIAMPFAQTHSGTVPELAGPLHNTSTTPAPLAPYAPPPLRVNTNFTGEQRLPRQPQITSRGTWLPWGAPCPEIVVDFNSTDSPADYPGSARSVTSSISSYDPHHHAYLLAHQSPASSSSHYSPYSDLSIVTPSSFVSMYDLENPQDMFSNQVSHAELNVPNLGFDTRFLSALSLSPSKSPHEDHLMAHSEVGSSSHATGLDNPPHPSTSAVMGLAMGTPQGLGQRNSSDNSSDSTLRLSLGQSPYSAPAPAFPVAHRMGPSPTFPIPEMNEEHDDDPVPEYNEGAQSTRRRKGEAISSVPLRQCFADDPLRRTLILRILAKQWLREHKVEPLFLSKDDDVTKGLEKQVSSAYGMKKGDSLFKAFEGQAGKCPFDGCPNVEPRAHRRISHVRTHFGLRPFSCDRRGCARCQARMERGLEYIGAPLLGLFRRLTRLLLPPTGLGASTTWTVSESTISH